MPTPSPWLYHHLNIIITIIFHNQDFSTIFGISKGVSNWNHVECFLCVLISRRGGCRRKAARATLLRWHDCYSINRVKKKMGWWETAVFGSCGRSWCEGFCDPEDPPQGYHCREVTRQSWTGNLWYCFSQWGCVQLVFCALKEKVKLI